MLIYKINKFYSNKAGEVSLVMEVIDERLFL